jgi:hypothetical protein
MDEVFGLQISEGAIANLLLRVKQQLQPTVSGVDFRFAQCAEKTSRSTVAGLSCPSVP